MRYRVLFNTTPSGGFNEFSADSDEAAIAQALRMETYHGRIVSLSEQVGAHGRRDVSVDQCPAGGLHIWGEQDSGDAYTTVRRWIACDECGAKPPETQDAEL